MNFNMPKSQEQLEQLQDNELEAIAKGGLDHLVKTPPLRGKVVRWAVVATSVLGISVGLAMPSLAQSGYLVAEGSLKREKECTERGDFFQIYQAEGARIDDIEPTMCFSGPGSYDKFRIADVELIYTGNNAGFVVTNHGGFDFKKKERINFLEKIGNERVTILGITLSP
ncbi:hypothetical protein H6G17_29260 [Chroococcidiopsis sp. FACHB-1243]|uniref:hypothetical protein n=1 Tax=Chroococcidiopsis sp. [FACHB-1243] TaxID=2692781 RepID=UPI00177C0238|nr:hypothetical protein [Chroococcidiopsis sp. [FACHB-1243]]MBD2309532.1 hypothetical protein [Chroococcidiopsis sp. [FACHB-1243]]